MDAKKILVYLYIYFNGNQEKILDELKHKRIKINKELVNELKVDKYITVLDLGPEEYERTGVIVDTKEHYYDTY